MCEYKDKTKLVYLEIIWGIHEDNNVRVGRRPSRPPFLSIRFYGFVKGV